jgi:exodeoxyribonuclease VII large subunit
LATGRTGLAALQRRLGDAWRRELSRRVAEFAALRRALNAVSPLGVMERGYALVTQPVSDRRYGPLVRSVRDVDAGDLVDAHLRDGVLSCRIESIDEPPDPQ